MLSQYITISLKLLWRKMMKLFFDEHETKKKGSGVLTEKRRNDLRVAGYTSENFFIVLTNKPLIDVFLYSHHSCAWNCIYFVRRNSVLVTHGYTMIRLNQLMRENPSWHGKSKEKDYQWDCGEMTPSSSFQIECPLPSYRDLQCMEKHPERRAYYISSTVQTNLLIHLPRSLAGISPLRLSGWGVPPPLI